MAKFIPLNQNRDFKRIYHRIKPFVFPELVVYVAPNRKNGLRIGLTAGKKVGSAVKRNRAKRIIRASLEPFRDKLTNVDIVIVARTRTPNLKSTQLEIVLKKAFTKAKILKEE